MSAALQFEDVTKWYPRWGTRYFSLRHDLGALARQVGRAGRDDRARAVRRDGRARPALDRVSFAVEEGKSVAIVGPNGAGKTTALKLASRISYPTAGRLRVRGRVGALIEVGSGVHPELTGRENVWLYGRILGMTKADIRRRFDDIVGFAELEHAIDTPVKTYSSGMQLRLGFAVASHVDPDIVVIDEALAVGDQSFQAKCIRRMGELVREGRTLVFVSHNLTAVERVCPRTVLLIRGRVMEEGPTPDVLASYVRHLASTSELADAGDGPVRLASARCYDLSGNERYRFAPREGVEFRFEVAADEPMPPPRLSVGISSRAAYPIVEWSSPDEAVGVGDSWEFRCRIPAVPLRPRFYRVHVKVPGWAWWREATAFEISAPGEPSDGSPLEDPLASPIDVEHSWTVVGSPARCATLARGARRGDRAAEGDRLLSD